MVLTQGLNRQIRRMCEYFDYRVTGLKRVRIMHFTLDGIATGGYREATEAELSELSRLLTGSGKGPEPLRRNKDDRRRK
jgi:23S rRNA pseudouridine2604 synthase